MTKAVVLSHFLGLRWCSILHKRRWNHLPGQPLFARLSSCLSSGLRSHLESLVAQHTAITEKLSSEIEALSPEDHRKLSKSHAELSPIVCLVEQLKAKEKDVDELNAIIAEKGELGKLAEEDRAKTLESIQDVQFQITKALIPKDDADENNAILEVRAGTGGKEASLFTHDIFSLYQRYAAFKKWKFEALSISKSEAGGYKEASASISGTGVFGEMKYEVGVHRVQRVPVTESMGRVHTSTMTVAVLPQPQEVDVVVNPNDLKIDTFRASGAGGQHVNMTDSAVRITHVPSGIVVSMQEERSQIKNKARAMQVLRARLYDTQRRQAQSQRAEARRQQIGTAQRSEKIRTYNFPQDRVTDHRLGETVHGVDAFLQAGDVLQSMVQRLRAQHEAQALDELTRRFTGEERS